MVSKTIPLSMLVFAAATSMTTAETVRFATFNASMNRGAEGDLLRDLQAGDDAQIRGVAETLQRIDADVVLVNEFDYDPAAPAPFQANYLARPQNVTGLGQTMPVHYGQTFTAPSNTGVPSGLDLNNDGAVGGPDDAFGFGVFPGQFGMAVFSKLPIVQEDIRTFQTFRWADMPNARLPADPQDADGDGNLANWYSEAERAAVRLSSKSHWDIPVEIGDDVVHFLVSHPTPPTFDGPEDRNGRRNADEIRFWADYIGSVDYIYDDQGRRGGLADDALFVIAGDLNADPNDGDSVSGAVAQLLDNARINTSMTPGSAGGLAASLRQGAANEGQLGDPRFDTADFNDAAPGNLRVDYLLPSAGFKIEEARVFWASENDPLFPLTDDFPFNVSDHRAVYADLTLPAPVPVPAGLPMLLSALGGMMLLRDRSKSSGDG